jgi:(p)ppGpp synthase/HD superfamily hydrolase
MAMNTDEAIALAATAHAGQLDDRGDSYLLHPLRVMNAVPAVARIAAILHDVVERSAITLDDLARAGVQPDDLDAVDLLTHRKEERSYAEYIERIAVATGRGGDIARAVKIADLQDKLSRLPVQSKHGASRYVSALARLGGSIDLAWVSVTPAARGTAA